MAARGGLCQIGGLRWEPRARSLSTIICCPCSLLEVDRVSVQDVGAPLLNGPIEDTHYEVRVPCSGADALQALNDFGPLRPEIWPESSHPRVYRVHTLGADWAEVTEGTPSTWSRERYDWSDPGVVTLTQLDSNVSRNGTIRYRIVEDGGGTLIACDRHREFYAMRGRLAGTVMKMLGTLILRRQLRSGIMRSLRLHPRR